MVHDSGAALVAIVSIGFGVGVSTAIFGVVDGVLLASLPYFDPEQTLESLETELIELCGDINAAEYRFLELLAEFDRLNGYEDHGLVTRPSG